MKSIELFRKIGYKRRYNNNSCVIYDLKQKSQHELLPDTILVHKNSKEIEFVTDTVLKYTHLGSFSFVLNKDLLQALNKQIEELENKL